MTIKELQRRFDNGEIFNKATRGGIAKEAKRKCAYRDCGKSLAFKSSRLIYCNSGCRAKEETRIRKANRLKKQRYYEKHGIEHNKTIRKRNASASSHGVAYEGQTLLYENYKEPLQPIEKGKGFGYYGTVAMTDDKTLVQCHICSNLFANVGLHLRKHKVSAEKYKEIYKLSATTALISEPVREQYQKRTVERLSDKKGLPVWLQEYNKKVQSGVVKHIGTKRKEGGMSLEKRNELGLCPDQVLEKIKDLEAKLGKVPGIEEFKEEYGGRYMGPIVFQHGSWSNAVRKACKYTREDLRRLDKDRLIEELQEFQKVNGRIPMTSDFSRGMLRNKGAYISKFGSLNNARIEAGMNAVIPMPFGQIIELTPEQYFQYKAGHTKATVKEGVQNVDEGFSTR